MSHTLANSVDRPNSSSAARSERGAVVVTGASSGIGEACAIHLAELGYRVLAGVRNSADYERIRLCDDGREPVMLDITSESDIAELVALVTATEPHGLVGLVNNAGVAAVGPIEALGNEQWREVIEINVLGTVAVTSALLPLLFKARGRVINISSGAGRVGFPLFGPYAASKFAIEAFSDVLRREIARHGIDVVCVQPGVVASSIIDKNVGAMRMLAADLTEQQRARYGPAIDSALRSASISRTEAASPEAVAPAVAKALSQRSPRARYVVGWDSRTAVICARLLPDRLIDFVIHRLTAR